MKNRFEISLEQLSKILKELKVSVVTKNSPVGILKGIYFANIDGKVSALATNLEIIGMVRFLRKYDYGYIENPFIIDYYELNDIKNEIKKKIDKTETIIFEHKPELYEVHIKCKDKTYVLYTFDQKQYPDISYMIKRDYVNLNCITLFSKEKSYIKDLLKFADKKHPRPFIQTIHIKTVKDTENNTKYLNMETSDNFCVACSDNMIYYQRQGNDELDVCIPVKYMEKMTNRKNEVQLYYNKDNDKVVLHTYYDSRTYYEVAYMINIDKDVHFPKTETIISRNKVNEADVKFKIYRDSFLRLDLPFENEESDQIMIKIGNKDGCLTSLNSENNKIDMARIENVKMNNDDLYFSIKYKTFLKLKNFIEKIPYNSSITMGINLDNPDKITSNGILITDSIEGINVLVSINKLENYELDQFTEILKEVA